MMKDEERMSVKSSDANLRVHVVKQTQHRYTCALSRIHVKRNLQEALQSNKGKRLIGYSATGFVMLHKCHFSRGTGISIK